jgi:hypothetical protein
VLTSHFPSTPHLPDHVHSILFQPSLSRNAFIFTQSELHPSCAPISSIRVPVSFPSDPLPPPISIYSLIRVQKGGYARHHSLVSSPVPRLCHTTDLTTTVTPQKPSLMRSPVSGPAGCVMSCHLMSCHRHSHTRIHAYSTAR